MSNGHKYPIKMLKQSIAANKSLYRNKIITHGAMTLVNNQHLEAIEKLQADDKVIAEQVLFYSTIDCSSASLSDTLDKVSLKIPPEFQNKLFAICIREPKKDDFIIHKCKESK